MPKPGDRIVIEVRAVNGLGKVGPSAFLAHTVDGGTELLTDQIAPNAATETYSNADAGPYVSAVPTGSCSVTVNPAVTCDILVTVEVDTSATNSSGATKVRRGSMGVYAAGGFAGGGTVYSQRPFSGNIAAGESQSEAQTSSYRFAAVAAGTPITFSVRGTDNVAATQDTTYSNLRIKVEVIKR